MNGFDAGLLSIEQAAGLYLRQDAQAAGSMKNANDAQMSFEDILKQRAEFAEQTSDVRFSKHANQRLESRNITLSQEQVHRLNQGVSRARDKSINESLVMMDNLAFIVNVKNNTVVTALEQNEDSIFTNIDGAVIV